MQESSQGTFEKSTFDVYILSYMGVTQDSQLNLKHRKKETNVTFKCNGFRYIITVGQLDFGATVLLFCHLFGNERFISVLVPQR